MKMMNLSPGVVSAMSALAAAAMASLAGDSNFLPIAEASFGLGQARPSYMALMAAALLSAGGTLSDSVPFSTGHEPPPAGLVPKIVVNPKRTCESSDVITPSMAVLSWDHELSDWVGQTCWVLLRQWN